MASSSSSGSRSPSPEPFSQTVSKKSHSKSKDKGKGKEQTKSSTHKPKPILKPQSRREEHGRNEGIDPEWAYEPPAGATLVDPLVDFGEFDWDEVKRKAENDEVEVWVVRVPNAIKPKYLENIKFDIPSSTSTQKKSIKVGQIDRKHTSYDVWSLPPSANDEDESMEAHPEEEQDEVIGGDEMKTLSCLLPRSKKGGKLFMAPKVPIRHIVVSAQPVTTSPPEDRPPVYQNPARPSYSKEVLTHRFMPLGSLAPSNAPSDISFVEHQEVQAMDVDVDKKPEEKKHKAKKVKKDKQKETDVDEEPKSKKRKGEEGEKMKKSKKVKA
ncbi:hypothetical protein C8Q75DRAFT_713833 [Abortiporus biennis]|nr:hypothetical protein C8Q75DRAFT_713833 [Abortiporus biennis]